jgi:hypothetical protein
MKKVNWKAIKIILFAYLAVSKMLYYINIVALGYDEVWRHVLQRSLQQDVLIIIIVVFIYIFDNKVTEKINKHNGGLAYIISAIGGLVIYITTLLVYVLIIDLALPTPANVVRIMTSSFMLEHSIIYFIIFVALTMKERFKKKEAYEYALDIQSTDIKIEMLKTLCDDGVLSQVECDKQEAKLLGMQSGIIKNENGRGLKSMDESQKVRLTKIYENYQAIDWVITFVFIIVFIFGVPNIPTLLITATFVACLAYTIWAVWLYIKVWAVKEIRNTGAYWFDWALAIGFIVFTVYLLYTILTGTEPLWVGYTEELLNWLETL